MQKIKILVNGVAIAYVIAVLDELFKWELNDDIYSMLALAIIIMLVWLVILVNSKTQ